MITIKAIEYGSHDYESEIKLRDEILRAPLGLSLNDEDLLDEKHQLHLCAFDETILIGCVLIKLLDGKAKIRQMAVSTTHQGMGFGKLFIKAAEDEINCLRINKIELNARSSALGFYRKLGYQIGSDVFKEIGIDHYLMFKLINNQN